MSAVRTPGVAWRRNPVLIIVAIGLTSFLCYHLLQSAPLHRWTSTAAQEAVSKNASASKNPTVPDAPCTALQGGDDVFVLLKTGAREARSMFPFHLQTTLKCARHFGIYSDVADVLDGVPIHDILSTLPELIRTSHHVFDTYRALKNASDAADVSRILATPPGGSKESAPGWQLDKWKFFPMLRAAHAHPTAKWFLFIETDTNIVWSNLLTWLSHFDSSKEHYLGGQSMFGDHLFAHGGSGFVLSRPAVSKAVAELETEPSRWLHATENECCGDSLLARLTHDGTDMRLLQSWPIVQGETVATLDYTAKHWCFPVVSQHHMHAEETRAMWDFEQSWLRDPSTSQQPILHSDVFERFLTPVILPSTSTNETDIVRHSWDNISKDLFITQLTTEDEEPDSTVRAGHINPEACQAACRRKRGCMQWSHRMRLCSLGNVIRMGGRVGKDSLRALGTTSGWMGGRINAFRQQMQPCIPRWILKNGDGP